MSMGNDGRDPKYIIVHNFARFDSTIEDNARIDTSVKQAILEVSPSVVCLISYIGDKQLFICSGIIMECECLDDTFLASILTSATLLRCPNGGDDIANGLKIEVIILGGKVFEGHMLALDFHYNLAVIQIKSTTPLSTASVRSINESLAIDEVDASVKPKSFHFALRRHTLSSSSRFTIYPGEPVQALGRHFMDPFDIMAARGEFSSDNCEFTCKELRKTSCIIKKNGMGGPIINRYGEVIGINFYNYLYTPFLPINIASKCFEHLKNYRYVPRPWLGVDGRDLHAVTLDVLEKIKKKFSFVARGVIIDEVERDSPAEVAGLRVKDVIIRCGGNFLGSRLELSEILWDKEGKPVELVVVRVSTGKQLKLIVASVMTNPIQNSWPVPEKRMLRGGSYRRLLGF